MSSPAVELLLLTYNRKEVLGELLDSLLAQTFSDWRILVRDNGSSDGSLDGLEQFQRAHPQRMTLLKNDREVNLGALEGFARLLSASTAPYAMFCDCDDVWLPRKIERTLECMRQLEQGHSPGTPLLVHTDLRVTDAHLTLLSDSFCTYEKLNPLRGAALNRLLVQNQVTGCTMMINASLRDLALPIPDGAILHDWWLALVAAAFGAIGFVPEPTVLYRQHADNAIGAREFSNRYLLHKAARFYQTAELRRAVTATTRQAGAFLERYGGRLREDQRRTVQAFASLPQANWCARRVRILRHRLYKHGWARNIGWLLRV
jgi:glycosyltransferase involved in cell wall biosynthesis